MDSTFKTASSIKHIDKKWPLGGATKPLNGREFSLDNPISRYEVGLNSEKNGPSNYLTCR